MEIIKGTKKLAWFKIVGRDYNSMAMRDKMLAVFKKSKIVCVFWVLLSRYGIVNEHELKILNRLVKKNDVAFDIGANIGSYTFALSKLVDSGKVIAIEPLPVNQEKLKFLKRILKLTNVIIEAKAVSNQKGKVNFTIPIVNGIVKNTRGYIDYISDNITENKMKNIEVETTTIVDLVNKHNLSRIDFIKCDVEGAERLVFEGGEDIIREMKPNIICEINSSMRYGISDQDVFNYIKNLCNYNVYTYNGQYLSEVSQILKEYDNYIFTVGEIIV